MKSLSMKVKKHIILNPFCIELIYFITLSSLGFLALKSTKPRTTSNDIDLFFTSVSASTVSSMSTVEMEVFTNTQLVFLTVLMLLGGEVFTSMLRLQFQYFRLLKKARKSEDTTTKLKSIKYSGCLVCCYLLVAHAVGSALVAVYLNVVPGARRVLETKGIKVSTFAVFTTVSTFSNCGFVPTNENMVVFRRYSGLLLILIPQVLMGNTMYPVFMRVLIWFAGKVMGRGKEFEKHVLSKTGEMGSVMNSAVCVGIGFTGLGLIVVQMVALCALEWDSDQIGGGFLSVYEKLVGFLFQVVNSRHAGESVFDLSALSPSVLVMFVLMMYLPPYTAYLPIEQAENAPASTEEKKKFKCFWEYILFSHLAYLVIFVFLICITERHKMKRDPLNFNALNIVVEVVSAYGNVGFSVGYSCERQIYPDGHCKDAWYGFVGKWSNQGKFLLVIVMFVGRLKKFNKRGGIAWSLA